MKILLQNVETGMYFAAPGTWTEQPEKALNFETGDAAIDTALEHSVKKGAVFYHFKDEKQNFSVPISTNG